MWQMEGTLDHIRSSSLKAREWIDSSSIARWLRHRKRSDAPETPVARTEGEKQQVEILLREIRGLNEMGSRESHSMASASTEELRRATP